MGSFRVRRATPDDLAALGTLGALLMRVHHAFDRQRFMDPGDRPEAGYMRFLAGQLAEEEAAVFVAERDAAVLGYVYAAIEPPSWKELRARAGYIHDIVVGADDRRSGVATALMTAAIDWLRERRVPRVLLGTAVQNEGAQALFARLGFRKTMIEMTREL